MSETQIGKYAIIAIASILIVLIIADAFKPAKPDAISQRIEACMTQPNMMYTNFRGCVPHTK